MALTSGVDTVAVQAGLPSYVVNGELDRGGYGITFDAMHAGERLAVKVLDTQSHEAAIRTPLEIAALRSVNDPHVVRMVDDAGSPTGSTRSGSPSRAPSPAASRSSPRSALPQDWSGSACSWRPGSPSGPSTR